METLSATTNDYALDSSIMALHSESRNWLEEISFYKDELVFFQNLISEKKLKHHGTKKVQELFSNLVKMNALLVQDLDKEVQKHQKDLEKLIEGKKSDDQVQRNRHRLIKDKFKNFTRDYFELKRKLFQLEK